MYFTAQLLDKSLSLSVVLNAMLLCHANESPTVPEYKPTSADTAPAHHQSRTCHIAINVSLFKMMVSVSFQ